MIILELTVVATASQAGGKIGNPVALPLGGATGSNGQQAAALQRPPQQQPQAMRAGGKRVRTKVMHSPRLVPE